MPRFRDVAIVGRFVHRRRAGVQHCTLMWCWTHICLESLYSLDIAVIDQSKEQR